MTRPRRRRALRAAGWVVGALVAGPPGLQGAAAASVTKRVQATGQAVVVGDLAAACDQARRSALREAVEEGVGVLVSSVTRVQNYAVIDERILSGTRGYVRSFEVLSRQELEGGAACGVTVEAVVDLGELHRDLDALDLAVVAVGSPRVVCVGVERREGDPAPLGWNLLAAETAKALGAMSRTLEVSAAPAGAEAAGADIVVSASGSFTATQAQIPFSGVSLAQTGLYAATASVHVEARWTDEGQTIAALDARGRGVGADPQVAGQQALRHGLSLLADSLRLALAEDLRGRAYAGRIVQVVVEGEAVGSSVAALSRDLAARLALPQPPLMRSVESDRAVFEVSTAVDAFALACQLSAGGLPQREVSILHVTPNRLHVALGAAGGGGAR